MTGTAIRIFLCLIGISAAALPLRGQQPDTLTLNEYLQQVIQHHPAARAAALLEEQGRMEVRSARGFFDPVLAADLDEKQFKDKTYYRIFGTELKATTRLGVGLKAGYDYAQGDYLNPERSVPSGGLWYAGVSVPLIQGLFFDEGRGMLRQAHIRQERYQWEQQQLLANLLYEATAAYWHWAGQFQQVITLQNAVKVAHQRFKIVRGGFNVGELPAIDTLEAFLQLQTLQSSMLEQEQELVKAEQAAASFFWSEGGDPLWVSSSFPAPLPPPVMADSLKNQANTEPLLWAEASPSVRLYGFKIAELEAERRWKAEKLKPYLAASYNILSSEAPTENPASYSPNNYKIGVSFKMPLLLRNARGELQLNRLKMQTAALEQRQKRLEVTNKFETLLASLQLLQQQIQLNQQLVNGYQAMWQGEQRKFEYGESTLFYVNARELKYLESRLKLLSLQIKFQQQEAELRRLMGISTLGGE
ncbi:outer membrane protein [Flammeovirgaceae bacterium 311]|nr:outer membrane protein [Flammeovirgaceae bacterium 311]